MFGGKNTFKRKTKITKDRGSSSDQGGEVHQKTKIKEKRKNVKGTNIVGPSNVVQPSTLQGTTVRGRCRGGYSNQSNQENLQRNIGSGNVGTTGFNQPGYTQNYGSSGYNQGYGSSTTGQQLDNFNQPTTSYTTQAPKQGFVEKMKYKLRSSHRT